jgi:hypothetical protein
VEGVAPKVGIELLLLEATLLLLLVPAGHVAGDGLTLGAGFSAFQNDVFARHGDMVLEEKGEEDEARGLTRKAKDRGSAVLGVTRSAGREFLESDHFRVYKKTRL